MFKVIAEITKDNFAKFIIGPLEAGYGHTLGNSLKRVLLTSLEGAAIASVKIEGVSHQFSTISGVSEDVIEILINLKKVRPTLFSDKPVKLVLKASGKKEVKAKDIEVLGEGEIANPEQHIATLNDAKAKLNMEMLAVKGKGYSLAEERKNGEIGMMAVDALFSPMVSVNYTVDTTRVGRRTDLDKLILDITTDGTIKPQEALEQASKLLAQNFKQIYEPTEVPEQEQSSVKAVPEELFNLTVEELDLPVRITNALRAIDINTVGQLVEVPRIHLLKAKNLGAKSLGLISEKLTERGLSLREA